jgi:hypothetical protein
MKADQLTQIRNDSPHAEDDGRLQVSRYPFHADDVVRQQREDRKRQ